MKLKTFLVSVFTVFIVFSFVDAGIGIGLDFKGGLNLAKMRGEDIDDAEDEGLDIGMRPGAIAGVGAGIQLIKFFCIQPEVLFTMKGTKMSGDLEDVSVGKIASVEGTVKINYLAIPILLKVTIPAGPVIPNVYVGPSLDICLTSEQEEKIDFTPQMEALGFEDTDTTVDMKDDTKGLDFGLAMGGGVDLKVGPGRIIFDIRYTLGFATIDNEEDEDLAADMKNGVLSFIVGFGIDFGR